jgi:hypothetical protein
MMPNHDAVTAAAIADAVLHLRREHVEIVALCNLAGRPDMAASFIRAEMSVDGVRRRLESLPALPAKPSAGGDGFDLATIERALTEKRTLQ